MKKETERRMCWNCEGYVSVHLTQCPYCRSFLQDPALSNDHEVDRQFQNTNDAFVPSHSDIDNFRLDGQEDWRKKNDKESQEEETIFESVLRNLSKIFLLLGMGLICFGVMLFLFGSEEGVTLHWSKKWTYFFILGGLPVTYWSYKSVSSSS